MFVDLLGKGKKQTTNINMEGDERLDQPRNAARPDARSAAALVGFDIVLVLAHAGLAPRPRFFLNGFHDRRPAGSPSRQGPAGSRAQGASDFRNRSFRMGARPSVGLGNGRARACWPSLTGGLFGRRRARNRAFRSPVACSPCPCGHRASGSKLEIAGRLRGHFVDLLLEVGQLGPRASHRETDFWKSAGHAADSWSSTGPSVRRHAGKLLRADEDERHDADEEELAPN